MNRLECGQTVELEGRFGRFIVLGCTVDAGLLRDPGPVLTLARLGFPGREPFRVSLGFVTRAWDASGHPDPRWCL